MKCFKETFKSIYFDININRENKLFEVTFKNKWPEKIYSLYMKKLKHYLALIAGEDFTLSLNCVEFGISIPELNSVAGDFLQVYRNAGFKHIRLITMKPQYEFRKAVKRVGDKIGFISEFTDTNYIKLQYC